MTYWRSIKIAPKDGRRIATLVTGFKPTVSWWGHDHKQWISDTMTDFRGRVIKPLEYNPDFWFPFPDLINNGSRKESDYDLVKEAYDISWQLTDYMLGLPDEIRSQISSEMFLNLGKFAGLLSILKERLKDEP